MTKISLSWLELKPNMDNRGDQEDFSVYMKRIRSIFPKYKHIPDSIFEQWIKGLHNNYDTLNNYAQIDYEQIEFDLVEWETIKFLDVRVIDNFSNYVKSKANFRSVNVFSCNKESKETWIKKIPR